MQTRTWYIRGFEVQHVGDPNRHERFLQSCFGIAAELYNKSCDEYGHSTGYPPDMTFPYEKVILDSNPREIIKINLLAGSDGVSPADLVCALTEIEHINEPDETV